MSKAEKRINELIEKKKFKNQKELIEEIYNVLGVSEDFKSWRKKNESNFSKMKSAKRDFTTEFKYALSEISGVSFSRFMNGEIDFDPFSFEYAAFINDRKSYEKLLKIGKESIQYNSDEKEKYFLDYVAEYCDTKEKLATPIKFLYENEIFTSSETPESVFKFLRGVIAQDDPEMFKWYKIKYLGRDRSEFNLISYADYDDEQRESFEATLLKDILSSDKILKDLLAPAYPEKPKYLREGEEYDGDEEDLGPAIFIAPDVMAQSIIPTYPFRLKKRLLECAFKNNDMDSVEKIFSSFEHEIYEQAKSFKSKNGTVSRKNLTQTYMGIHYLDDEYSQPREENLIIKSEIYSIGSELNSRLNTLYSDRNKKLDLDGMVSFLTNHSLSNMKDGEIIENRYEGKIYHKCEKNIAYKMLDEATKRGFDRVPEYFGEESGVQITERYSLNIYEYTNLIELMEALSEFHDFSKEALGDGMAYVYKDYSKHQFYYNKKGKLSFGGWQSGAESKTTEYALCNTLSYVINTTRYNDTSYEREFENIKNALKYYTHDPSLLVNLGDRLIKWIDEKLSEIDRSNADGKKECKVLSDKRTFVCMYRDELNGISV